ncbi:MAG: lysylphosphatidylglycerol synthase transmembrane domain-containing protein [Phycisphaerae bacterium]
MSAKGRSWLWTVLRIAVCAVALGWVLYGVRLHDAVELSDGRVLQLVDQSDDSVTVLQGGTKVEVDRAEVALDSAGAQRITYGLWTVIGRSNHTMLLLSVVAFLPVSFLQSLRFQWLLRAQDVRISYWESVKLCFAGNFLNFAAPGTTGGDVVKAYYITLHTDQKTEAVTTVFLDRVAGLAGLLTMVGVVSTLYGKEPRLRYMGLLGLAVLGGLLLGGALLISERLRTWLGSRRISRRLTALADAADGADTAGGKGGGLSARLLSHARRADRATRRLLKHRPLVLGAYAVTVLLQVIALSVFVLIAYAVGMDFAGRSVFDYYASIAAGLIVGAVPISPQGLGTMEAVFKHFLVGTHGNLSQVLCLAMGVRFVQLLWALPGVLVTMTGAYSPPSEPSKVVPLAAESSSAG